MPESLREYARRRRREIVREICQDPQQRQYLLSLFSPEVLLEGLTVAQRLKGLSPEQRVIGLTLEQLEELAAKLRQQQTEPKSG